MKLRGTSRINEQGHLEIGGCDTVELAHRFGTPLYVMDETMIRRRIRSFVEAFEKTGLSYRMAYASKAFSTLAMCRLVAEEGLHLDVVSDGELYTALKAGFPPERIYFHGNNKTLDELVMALDAGIGRFVADNFTELALLDQLARDRGRRVKVILRTTPGVEAHTHHYIQTGQEDSKFGFDLESGQVHQALKQCLTSEGLEPEGFHCHIGSQIFESDGFRLAVRKMAALAAECRQSLGFRTRILNLGGGFGIRYNEKDQPMPVDHYIAAIAEEVRQGFAGGELPQIWLEPGRSIVGEAGTTLYRVGTVKEIPGLRKYVAVDGGMNDNPRPALYHASYEASLANRAGEEPAETVSIAGKLCESGDMLIWDIPLPRVNTGDLLAVSCTGAYNYSMANNYNRLRRPAVVFVRDGEASEVVRRETLEDLIRNDRVPGRMGAPESLMPSE
ncbi:diaminopimelate decarboxylase [Kroppenstedtia eburnea]|uniref:Diaminopimelate decarboxylase n=1 Tax=Kroppenstedtia eburnea TaxID=714067 RepID=A0A1N7INN9_9BACL|nr:diaminopimelate decarboxylase [Kroppenstedtia eburnea]EGK14160.1 diaminopimelate decarboxylase [Desmospora sp. 8437]QKI82008.1 diaminopimelate decarboxylase [Kroppenstedtia eburnea]SIS38616.1 diaminopimelate decarboxylase [Kroppenstedtia eburnea]